MNRTEINTFLAYGFNFGSLANNTNYKIMKDIKIKENTNNIEELLNSGISLFKSLFTKYEKSDNYVIPMSGGLDSRTLQIGLLSHGVPRENILNITFGSPGNLDYEIGKGLSRKTQVKNKRINLSKINLSFSDMVKSAENHTFPISFIDYYYNRLILNYNTEKVKTLVGYMGDPIAGSHLIEKSNWEDSINIFFRKHIDYTEVRLFNSNFRPREMLPKKPLLENNINYYDQLDFILRQEYFVKPIVLIDEEIYDSPFLNKAWIEFFLSLDSFHRRNRFLFKKIMEKVDGNVFNYYSEENYGFPTNYPEIMVFPSKLKRKLLKVLKSKGLLNYNNIFENYIDMEEHIRSGVLKGLVYDAITSLNSRNLIDRVDIMEIYNKHLNGYNYTKSLVRLTNLEVFLSSR